MRATDTCQYLAYAMDGTYRVLRRSCHFSRRLIHERFHREIVRAKLFHAADTSQSLAYVLTLTTAPLNTIFADLPLTVARRTHIFKLGPIFSEHFLEYWSPDQYFCRTKISVTALQALNTLTIHVILSRDNFVMSTFIPFSICTLI